MEDKLFDALDDLNIRDTRLLLDKDINLSVDYFTRRRIEESVKKRTGYYNKNSVIKDKINNILGGIFMNKRIALALSVGVILSLAGGGYAYAKTPVAYVSMDINPSVELGVSAFDKVVSVEAYNEDGEKILEGTDLINYDIDNAVSTVISNAIAEGYINEDGLSAIEITTATDKKDVATKLDESLKEVVDDTLDNNNVEAKVETEKVALVRRDEARKLGITPGKLNLIQKLQELDPTINVEDYKSSSVKDIQKKTKELRQNNKSDETTTGNSTINDTNVDVVTEDANLSETSVDPEEATIIEQEKNNNNGNVNIKKEENSNVNIKKEENNNVNEEKKTTTTTTEKQNNGNNVNSKEINNYSKSESNGRNSNSSKSDNSASSNSSPQNKDKNKNN